MAVGTGRWWSELVHTSKFLSGKLEMEPRPPGIYGPKQWNEALCAWLDSEPLLIATAVGAAGLFALWAVSGGGPNALIPVRVVNDSTIQVLIELPCSGLNESCDYRVARPVLSKELDLPCIRRQLLGSVQTPNLEGNCGLDVSNGQLAPGESLSIVVSPDMRYPARVKDSSASPPAALQQDRRRQTG